jgi:hypothetical protein
MRRFLKVFLMAEEKYMPLGPPLSPLTKSFFMTWALFDLQFNNKNNVAFYVNKASKRLELSEEQVDALNKLSESRMGVYEHLGTAGRYVRLRELVTETEFTCLSTSGHQGKPGELWYVRVLPPLKPDSTAYHISFTTPYILMAGKQDWLQYLTRMLPKSIEDTNALYHFFKHGPSLHYWNDFVFAAYHSHTRQAIYLKGIPDIKSSLPHAQ